MRYFCVFRYQSSDYEGKLPNKQNPRQNGDKKQNRVKCKGHENEQNTRKSKSCLTSNATASFKTEKNQSPRSEPKKDKVDNEKKRKDKKITDMASAFGFEEEDE